MRLRTILTSAAVYAAMVTVIKAGKVHRMTGIDECTYHSARTHPHGFEIALAYYGEKVKGDGRYWRNGGSYGANKTTLAATYDEWGWFIAELMRLDPTAIFGGYKGEENYHQQTKNKFRQEVTV